MSAKRVFFGALQKIMVVCCAIFFGFANAFSANLPSGYTELEYIESTGTQYFDTGIVGKSGVSVEAKFMLATDANGSLFGNRQSDSTRFWPAMWFKHTGSSVWQWNATVNVDTEAGTVNKNTLYTTYFVSNSSGWTFDVNGERVSSGTQIGSNTNNMWMFGTNDGRTNTLQYPFIGKAYYAKIWQNGALVRNFVPAKRNSDNVVGMYDTVSGTFFTNQGTGTFTAGPVVLNPCRNLLNVNDSNRNNNHYLADENSTVENANFAISDYIAIPAGTTTLTYSTDREGTGLGQLAYAAFYTANKTYISSVQQGKDLVRVMNVPNNAAYIKVSFSIVKGNWQLEEGSTATAYVPYNASCHNPNGIKIATTAYNAARFSPVVTDLNSAVATIREIVTKTINQTAAIASLQADKQTRPEDACPAGKKCLLVETEENGVIVPHWFPIVENICGLPSGYTCLEYIQSTGTQYIDTGLKGNLNTKVEIDMQIPEYTSSHVGYFMGTRTNQNEDAFLIGSSDASLSQNGKYFAQFDSVVASGTAPTFDLNRHVLSLSSNGFYVDNQLYISYSNPQSFTTQENIPLFARYSAGTLAKGAFRVFSFKMYNNSTLVRNLIPAKNSSGVIGMYDTVNDRFYTNAGTGTFTAGPEI